MNPIVDAAKGIVEGIAAPIDSVGRIMNQKEINNLAQQEMSMRPDTAQIEVNKIEAASINWWVAGWRPAIGWTCCAALAYSKILYPMVGNFLHMQPIDDSSLTSILLSLLGLGGLRTYEKVKGLNK